MRDHNNQETKQEQVKTEVSYQTLSEFLQHTPPNQWRHISDISVSQHVGGYARISREINTPMLELPCLDDLCNGSRFFRNTGVFITNGVYLNASIWNYVYVTYQCSNCKNSTKVYSLAVILDETELSRGMCYKFGEFPEYGPLVPSRLIKLIGPDKDIFLKGRKCENQGLGIGAFVYYRRVVENQKNRILGEIIKVFEKISVPQEKIDTLQTAINETQFRKALEMAKDVMPESLLMNGHSPILLLHRALSQGVHDLSDEECLELASTVRHVLGELSERLAAILKDKTELAKAISTLLHSKS